MGDLTRPFSKITNADPMLMIECSVVTVVKVIFPYGCFAKTCGKIHII